MNSNVMPSTNDLAVLVLSCDNYSDLWPIFFKQYKKYWNQSEFKLYLACNEKSSNIDGVVDAKSGPDIDWSTSLKKSLVKVEENNVLIMIDDAFLKEEVNHQDFLELYNRFLDSNMDYLRLKNSPLPDIKVDELVGQISPGSLYRTALFPSVWKKDVLIDILKPGESAWEFELKGSDRSDIYSEFYSVHNDVFKIIHGVIKGKWHPKALSDLRKLDVEVNQEREVLTFREVQLLNVGTFRSKILKLFPNSARKNIRRFVYSKILNKEWFS
ncbi:hypothetical protein GCM10027342_14640 [Photobacterium alginatilyticum]